MSFPKDFVWGAAAASYQIEGGRDADGCGSSVWDEFCAWEGKIWDGKSGREACDHYHRYEEDVALMQAIGLHAYRLSISWPRVLPEGTGAVNEAGLGFYDRLVDALLEAGVQPWVTLFHWDYPFELYKKGGWLHRESVGWFAEYTGVLVDRLSDRVQHWMTLNEPQCFIRFGHGTGMHAPGLVLPVKQQLLATHHALMSHGEAVRIIRERAKAAPTIGWAPVGLIHYPATDTPENVEAARRATRGVRERNGWNNAWYSDPVVFGHYPEDGLRLYGDDAPSFTSSDLDTIHQPLDFYGANIYNGFPVQAGPDGEALDVEREPGYELTCYHWPVEPQILYWGPKFLYETYGLPIVITENGMACHDWVTADGAVHDPQRIDFLQRYLAALKRAIDEGVDVDGYFQWSAMDNFEWNEGYKIRMGLIHVDFTTQKRTLKDSAHWYGQTIRSNGAEL